ncbi:MAG TPA: BON domain-containing protein [Pyrinomonadaceae bacterium]|nr:BON domain-containing protein [Pyrinomonadaceae bacterium]
MSNRYQDREDDRDYDRENYRYGRRSDYGSERGRYGRGGGYTGSYSETPPRYTEGAYSGADYGSDYGRGYEGERDYGLARGYGITQGARYSDYGETSGRYSQRYNYPSGYRSGERYGSGYGRGYYGGRESGERGWWDRASDEVASWFGDEEAERRRRRDEYRSGEYRGHGPRGYKRSDERIKEDVNDRLTDDAYLDASDIEVEVNNGEVTLAGAVRSRNDKRRAEDLVESVSGVSNVQNNIRVRRNEESTKITDTTRSRTANA